MISVNRKQKQDETIENYARALDDLASACKYSDCCRDRLIRDSFISGLRSSHILGGLLQECELHEKRTLNEIVAKAKLLEQISNDAHDIRPSSQVNKTDVCKSLHDKSSSVPGNYVCIRCGARNKHFAKHYWAVKKQCNVCKKTGHISSVCKTKKRNFSARNVTSETGFRTQEFPQNFCTILGFKAGTKIKERRN